MEFEADSKNSNLPYWQNEPKKVVWHWKSKKAKNLLSLLNTNGFFLTFYKLVSCYPVRFRPMWIIRTQFSYKRS
jgi:hypothetical protein